MSTSEYFFRNSSKNRAIAPPYTLDILHPPELLGRDALHKSALTTSVSDLSTFNLRPFSFPLTLLFLKIRESPRGYWKMTEERSAMSTSDCRLRPLFKKGPDPYHVTQVDGSLWSTPSRSLAIPFRPESARRSFRGGRKIRLLGPDPYQANFNNGGFGDRTKKLCFARMHKRYVSFSASNL
jgi:hypothetical protein